LFLLLFLLPFDVMSGLLQLCVWIAVLFPGLVGCVFVPGRTYNCTYEKGDEMECAGVGFAKELKDKVGTVPFWMHFGISIGLVLMAGEVYVWCR